MRQQKLQRQLQEPPAQSLDKVIRIVEFTIPDPESSGLPIFSERFYPENNDDPSEYISGNNADLEPDIVNNQHKYFFTYHDIPTPEMQPMVEEVDYLWEIYNIADRYFSDFKNGTLKEGTMLIVNNEIITEENASDLDGHLEEIRSRVQQINELNKYHRGKPQGDERGEVIPRTNLELEPKILDTQAFASATERLASSEGINNTELTTAKNHNEFKYQQQLAAKNSTKIT